MTDKSGDGKMQDNRDFNESKLDAAEIKLAPNSPFFAKLENFWFYHKWKVIIITFFAIVLIVGIVQMVNKTEADASVVIAVPETVTPIQSQEISAALQQFLPSDQNKDGKKEIDVHAYAIYSEEEFNEANQTETETEPNGDWHYVPTVNQSYNVEQYEQYTAYLQNGEAAVVFVSEYLYEKLRSSDRVLPLSEIFGEKMPAGALSDGYGVRLSDLAIYSYVEALGMIPEDTVVCMLRPYVFGKTANEEKYSYAKEFYKNIVKFAE